MDVSGDIRRIGFRRWYERQLVYSHAYLVGALFGLILLLAGYEALDYLRGTPMYYLAIFLAAAGAGIVMLISWRRFTTLLERAERFAGTAECPQCRAWGSIDVIAAERVNDDEPLEAGRPHWLRVKCRKCGTDWRMG
jgi:hypothetical protein